MAVSNKRRAALALQWLGVWLWIVVAGTSGSAGATEAAAGISQQILVGAPAGRIAKLLDAGADPLLPDADGDTALHHAAMAQNPAYLKLLLARGWEPDSRNRISGRTPLMAAMLAERERQFAMLLAAGASVAQADVMGNTPLHVAAQINEPRHVWTLLEAGAPPTARNAQGQTFQPYLFMIPDRLLNAATLRWRQDVASWLRRKGIAIEQEAP
ncbi:MULTISPECIES: ankyrin repeat domain-containing protein [unclassified Sphingopyxis]|uniref:ankyrin repeat domain-containing protein n=1 Tax=unclassified Sphingopyxis TaxID=2614943 RepID=UPI002862A8DC|nr:MULTISPECIES: ankyrin repeat domain-containing protein [unclassified Sphingopyxis]MDR6832425.1 ankyrin repeat protein [Sphingopyxis sp. BE122]MDR7228168.1 ankyrin repeat protein [Sphingopyxis sp. BE259]